MQDEYVKTFEKIQLDDDRKMEMRKALVMEMASVKKPAKKTRLGAGAKAGIAAAAVAVTIGGLMAFPATRNVIASSIKNLVKLVVPDGAVDVRDQERINRDERVIPTDEVSESQAEEIMAIVSEQDRQQDEYFESVIVNADYYSDPELNELANYYAQQGYSLLDLRKDAMFLDYEQQFDTEDWFSEGFFLTFQIGDNASPSTGRIMAFKADEKQLHGFLENKLSLINYEREMHGQNDVSFNELWVEITDADGNTVYTGSWTGPEPDLKLLPSDNARFMNLEVTYDPETQIAVCYIEDGGGVG